MVLNNMSETSAKANTVFVYQGLGTAVLVQLFVMFNPTNATTNSLSLSEATNTTCCIVVRQYVNVENKNNHFNKQSHEKVNTYSNQ